MNQPAEPLPQYPASAPMPAPPEPSVPRQVRTAVKAMYAGAAVSIIGVIIEIASIGATKAAIARRSHNLTASQLNASDRALIIGFVISGLVTVAAWILIARACQKGSNGARITGTVLFALATLDALVGLAAPLAPAVRAWWPVIWLCGLIAVIFLWQRASTDFFKGSTRS
jgi:hypothetical protein